MLSQGAIYIPRTLPTWQVTVAARELDDEAFLQSPANMLALLRDASMPPCRDY